MGARRVHYSVSDRSSPDVRAWFIRMIVFELGCDNAHRFEGWFASGQEFERQLAEKSLACPMCGSESITRMPHASYVNTGSTEPETRPTGGTSQRHYANLGAEILSRIVERIVESTEDVGSAFPEEARKIHYREAPERGIRGTASAKDVVALKEEGIEVVALPIPPGRVGRIH